MIHVFIVEDSALVRGHLIEMLSRIKGVRISGFADEPYEAAKEINSRRPDLVILDIQLFGGTGMDVLKGIRKVNGLPVVVVLTNYPFRQYREKCMELGADYFFDKTKEFNMVPEVIAGFYERCPDS